MCLTTIIGTFSAFPVVETPPSQALFLPAQWPNGYYDIAGYKPEYLGCPRKNIGR